MVKHWPSSSLSTGCVVSLRGDWANFCHAGPGRVGRVWSAREKSLEILRRGWELNPGHGEDRQWDIPPCYHDWLPSSSIPMKCLKCIVILYNSDFRVPMPPNTEEWYVPPLSFIQNIENCDLCHCSKLFIMIINWPEIVFVLISRVNWWWVIVKVTLPQSEAGILDTFGVVFSCDRLQ